MRRKEGNGGGRKKWKRGGKTRRKEKIEQIRRAKKRTKCGERRRN